jgi:PAS domain S-box-containing protein
MKNDNKSNEQLINEISKLNIKITLQEKNISDYKQTIVKIQDKNKITNIALDTQLDTFFLFDPITSKAVQWNKSFTKISGYTDDEIAKLPAPASYYSPKDLERAENFIQKILEDNSGTIELELICKDGQKIPFEYKVVAVNNEKGEPKNLLSIGRNITERKTADEEMLKLAAVVKYSSELVNLSTLDGKMTFLNESGGQMLGIKPHEVKNFNIMEVIPDHLKGLVEKELLPALMKDGIWEGDLQYRNIKTGVLTDVHAMTFTIKDPISQKPLFLANVSLDITERKQAEEKLKSRNKELETWAEVTTDRELKMLELKKEINELLEKTGEKPKYKIPT